MRALGTGVVALLFVGCLGAALGCAAAAIRSWPAWLQWHVGTLVFLFLAGRLGAALGARVGTSGGPRC